MVRSRDMTALSANTLFDIAERSRRQQQAWKHKEPRPAGRPDAEFHSAKASVAVPTPLTSAFSCPPNMVLA